ncbi:MAG TPA: glycosyltransferase [Thermoanaerobaculia bacterium]|nr:glycosyltransferase [Thermoanaerobaculia bacterium]
MEACLQSYEPESGVRSRRLPPSIPGVDAALESQQGVLERLISGEEDHHSATVLLRALLLQRWFSLGEAELLAELADRKSWQSFCRLEPGGALPPRRALAALRARVDADPDGREALDRLAESGRRQLRGPVPVISVVSPIYRAEVIVAELVRRIVEAVAPVTECFEIVLVDDGSPDQAWERIEECCAAEPRVVGVRLSRNFGQHPAITAGLAHARGDWVVVMDCDLQDNPSYIPELYRRALDGYDIVFTIKEKREHGAVKNWFARQFARGSNWLSSRDAADPRIGAYSLISRRVVEAFLRIQDAHRHYLVLLRWLGFSSTTITVRHEPRFAGRSSYSALSLFRHAVDGIVSHSDRLLYLSVAAGFSFLCLSLLGIGYLVIAYLESGFRAGWTSTIVLILLCTSMILLSIGTAGIYIGKIFEQVKQRPLYLIERVRSVPAHHVRESPPGG